MDWPPVAFVAIGGVNQQTDSFSLCMSLSLTLCNSGLAIKKIKYFMVNYIFKAFLMGWTLWHSKLSRHLRYLHTILSSWDQVQPLLRIQLFADSHKRNRFGPSTQRYKYLIHKSLGAFPAVSFFFFFILPSMRGLPYRFL